MNTLQKLSRRIAALQLEFIREKERLRGELGRHDGATVYLVKPTRVKAYTRRGFRAVRVHK